MHFLEWKYTNFDYDFTEICSWGFDWQHSSIGLVNGLALARWQAIIWTNDGLGYRSIYASLGLSEFSQITATELEAPIDEIDGRPIFNSLRPSDAYMRQ